MPANESYANSLVVEVAGHPLPADVRTMLAYAYVEDSRNLPDLFVLRFRDPGHVVLGKTGLAVGVRVALAVRTSEPGPPFPLLTGEVTAVGLDLDATGTYTEVRGYDESHRLMRGRRIAAYPNMTVADVVRAVAQRAGLRVGRIDAGASVGGDQHTQFSQGNVSDWEFLTALADLVGAQVYVADGALEFRSPGQPHGAPDPTAKATTDPLVLEAHRTLTALRATISAAGQVSDVEVRAWDAQTKAAVTASAPPRAAGTDVAGLDPAGLARPFGGQPLRTSAAPVARRGAVPALAAALAAEVGAACADLSGVAKGNPRLRAGTAVALTNVGEPFAGKYTLTCTRHLFGDPGGYTTEFTVSGGRQGLTGGLSGGTAVRSGPAAGLAPAIVSDVRDPAGLGRVRLTFPWLSADYTSGWARVAQSGAGDGYGMFVLPEVGDEVLVGFGADDLDAPYVIGGLHNGHDAPPTLSAAAIDGTSGEIVARGFRTPAGHRIEFLERGGVVLATGDGKLTVALDSKASAVAITSDHAVTISGRSGITIDAGTGELSLKGQKVALDATTSVAIGGATVAVTGQTQAELTANGSVTVRAGLVRIN